MNLKTYQADTMAEALALVKRDLGTDAVILHTRATRTRGLLGFGAKSGVEVTASSDVAIRPRKQKPKPAPRPEPVAEEPTAAHVLKRAYQQGMTDAAQNAAVATAPPPVDTQLTDEVRALREMVHCFMRTSGKQEQPTYPEPLFNQYLDLLKHDVSKELAEELINEVQTKLGGDLSDTEQVKKCICEAMAKWIPTEPAQIKTKVNRKRSGCPHVIALIGPTGVGKTTTLAKLAATYKLRDGLKVALVTIDTYRIAAVDQLKTYAQIIGLPLHVAQSPMELKQTLHQCQDCDVVLIDTAGRSQRDDAKLEHLQAFMKSVKPDEVHLVLSSTASQNVLLEAVDRFSAIRADRIIFTKLDEAVSFGVLLDVMRRVDKKLSFVTTGQEVPHQIEAGDAHRLADLILGGELS